MRDPEACVFVAELDGQVVGYVYAGLEPMSWKELREAAGFIHDVVVADTHRGHGVGEALVEARQRLAARARRAASAVVDSRAQRGRAASLFATRVPAAR